MNRSTTMKSKKGRKFSDSILRKKYGIGIHQYETLLEEQDNTCYICNKSEWRDLAVDHNHETGEVRRLLCTSCNTGLGLFQDDPKLLKAAADYLETEFELPEDKEIVMKPHKDRPRWRRIVTTPDGVFDSLEAAGKFYNVHPTTVGYWCGTFKNYPHLSKDEFSAERVFK